MCPNHPPPHYPVCAPITPHTHILQVKVVVPDPPVTQTLTPATGKRRANDEMPGEPACGLEKHHVTQEEAQDMGEESGLIKFKPLDSHMMVSQEGGGRGARG